MSELPRSRRARELAQEALVRLVAAYGTNPRFVLLGGLVPDLLCTRSQMLHIGTTDIDLQVNLEIHDGSPNVARLETALRASGFSADSERAWRWHTQDEPASAVRAEFLADIDDAPGSATIKFDKCNYLGAVNLRGTGLVGRDWEERKFSSVIDSAIVTVELPVARLAGYLLAKIHAAYGRRATKDWYDVAFVLLHNDEGGPAAAGDCVRSVFGSELLDATRTALADLADNFATPLAQGPLAYAETVLEMYPGLDWDLVVNDAVIAVAKFLERLDANRDWATEMSEAPGG